MAMADVAGERSASLPMPASLAKRCRSPDDALKRCKRHHCHGDSPVAVAADGEVDDGEIIGDAAATAAAAMDVDADSAARGHREGSSSRSGSDYLLQPDNSWIVTKDGTAGKGGVVVHGSKIMRAKGIQIRIDMTGLKVHMKGTGKTDQQLALHEQDDPVKTKITEEARRIKEAVTAKHVPQQVQKQQVVPPAGIRKSGKDKVVRVERDVHPDNWDDAVGYYSYRLGELLDGRYEIQAALGKGVFSTVVRAKDLKAGKDDPQMVAIKIARNNDTMFKAGKEEVSILGKLASADSEDKRHCVRFISNFRYRNHLCLVFESLSMNLREVLKKFGRNIGLKLTAVRAYAKQLFIALKHLKNCKVLHCDIKLDNILVNEARNVLKLCDFGNAMLAGMNEVTPYLVSRFYRAPEIILGLPYDHPLDMWSVGCCLYELYTGEILFPGTSNNDMLRRHMELKGPFPKKMLRKGAFTMQHFNQDLNFVATEEHPVTKKAVIRLVLNIKPKGIGSKISNSHGEDPKMLSNFKDLLDKIFVLDPEKRITVAQALSHPFITGKGK